MNRKVLKNFFKENGKIIEVDFYKYKKIHSICYYINKLQIKSHSTPLECLKKYNKFSEDIKNQISFEDFISILVANNIWDENVSMDQNIQSLLKKRYGYNKIYYFLKHHLFSEEKIKLKLREIPYETWMENGKYIAYTLFTTIQNKEMDQKKKKITNKLITMGYREEEILSILQYL